jgi:hypothetical protein
MRMPKGFDVNYTLALLQLTAAQKYWFGPSTLPADVGGQRDQRFTKDIRRRARSSVAPKSRLSVTLPTAIADFGMARTRSAAVFRQKTPETL